MNRIEWTKPVSRDEASRRANGRAGYNHLRKLRADLRRVNVAKKLIEYGIGRGVQSQIGYELEADRATICRDIDALRAMGWDRWSRQEQWEWVEREIDKRHRLYVAAERLWGLRVTRNRRY
jgi:hypothetical protein